MDYGRALMEFKHVYGRMLPQTAGGRGTMLKGAAGQCVHGHLVWSE